MDFQQTPNIKTTSFGDSGNSEDNQPNHFDPEESMVRFHALSKIALAIVLLIGVFVVADGLSRGNPTGSILLRLPFFVHGNVVCNRVNGGFDLGPLMNDSEFLIAHNYQDLKVRYDQGECFTRSFLMDIFERRKKHLEQQTGATLAEILPKKFAFASFSESPLFRFIQSQSPDRRANHSEFIKNILNLVEKVTTQSDSELICQKIRFEEKIATISCIARGKETITSRNVVLSFLGEISRDTSLVIINHPDSIEMRQLEDKESTFETESSFDLHLISRSASYETDILPNPE